MNASDIMTSNVVTVTPDQSVQRVAELLLEHRISGMPVLSAKGELVGLVSEGDLMRRAENGTEHHRAWWLRLLMGREGLASEYIREHARKVEDVMTLDVVTAAPDTPVSEIAELFDRRRIKRVPIVKDGAVVGVVSRANVIQALSVWPKAAAGGPPVADEALRTSVLARLNAQPWMRTGLVNVAVHEGAVDLQGVVGSSTERKAMRVATETTPGVRSVHDDLIVPPIATAL